MRPDGTGLRNLTANAAEDNGPRISPDGSRIAFFSNRDGNFEIYVMGRDGGAPLRLTHDEGRDICPTWSPDGEWIAFESNRSGTSEIYRIRPDGTALTRLTDDRTPRISSPQLLATPHEALGVSWGSYRRRSSRPAGTHLARR